MQATYHSWLLIRAPYTLSETQLAISTSSYQQEVHSSLFKQSPVEPVNTLDGLQGGKAIKEAWLNLHDAEVSEEIIHAGATGLQSSVNKMHNAVAGLDVTWRHTHMYVQQRQLVKQQCKTECIDCTPNNSKDVT